VASRKQDLVDRAKAIYETKIDRYNLFARSYPDTGPLRRQLYPKHMEFLAAGAHHQERCFMAANRVGKTFCGGYELTCHLTGDYPDWWVGHRWRRPIVAWAVGEDIKAVRESLQVTMFGLDGQIGTGLIPKDAIDKVTARSGVPGSIDAAAIKYKTGGTSRLLFKTYDQGRESFQGAKIDFAWCDEEPKAAVYSEILTRTMSTVIGEPSGRLICTFTPLKGLSAVVLSYMPGGTRVDGELPLPIGDTSHVDSHYTRGGVRRDHV
jgi:phage terminase large subunit-like protein